MTNETPTPQPPTSMDHLNAWLSFCDDHPESIEDYATWAAGFEACRSLFFGLDAAPAPFDVEHIDHVLISGSNFTPRLWRLMVSCDEPNLARLSMAFPHHAAALQRWKLGPNTDHDHNLEAPQ